MASAPGAASEDTEQKTELGDEKVVHPPHHQPEAMSRRARVYLWVAAARHFSVGFFLVLASHQFTSTAFIPIISYLPLWAWGGLFVLGAVVSSVGAITRSGDWARWGLIVSAAVLGTCCAGIWIGIIFTWLRGQTATPFATIFMTVAVIIDLIMCTQPLRVPFETTIRRLLAPKEP